MRTVAAVARGNAAVGGGPHEFDRPRFHHSVLAANHAADAAPADTRARCCTPGMRVAATAVAICSGAKAGKVYRHWPKLVATPLPPAKPLHTG